MVCIHVLSISMVLALFIPLGDCETQIVTLDEEKRGDEAKQWCTEKGGKLLYFLNKKNPYNDINCDFGCTITENQTILIVHQPEGVKCDGDSGFCQEGSCVKKTSYEACTKKAKNTKYLSYVDGYPCRVICKDEKKKKLKQVNDANGIKCVLGREVGKCQDGLCKKI